MTATMYVEVVVTDPNHRYEEIPSVLGFVERVCKGECGNRDMILRADETLTLSAFCQETLSFTLEANSSDEVAYVVDGENRGLIDFSVDGEATVTIEGLEAAGHTVEFINYSENDVYVKNAAINGAFHRYDTVYEDGVMYLEMLGKEENLEYSDFYAYIRTSDPSGTYYMRYKFDYIHNTTTNDYRANTQTNIGSYRLNGGELVQITETSETSITATVIEVVLGGGEVSLAIRQKNPYMDLIPEGIENQTYGSKNDQYYIYPEGKVEAGQCVEHVGGFHGDEWLSAVALIADGTVIDLKTSDKKVMACNSLLFDLTTTMYAWGTSREGNRGLAFAEHVQNFVINSKGIYHMQEIEWLRGDYDPAGYMPMFTMMRGGLNNRFIDTMSAYDKDGNMVAQYTMTPDPINAQTNVCTDWAGGTNAAYEYSGSKGVNARVEFRAANDKVKLASYIAMRVDPKNSTTGAYTNGSADNKLYVPFSRVNGGMPEQGEVWMVESHYMIDYNSENIQ